MMLWTVNDVMSHYFIYVIESDIPASCRSCPVSCWVTTKEIYLHHHWVTPCLQGRRDAMSWCLWMSWWWCPGVMVGDTRIVFRSLPTWCYHHTAISDNEVIVDHYFFLLPDMSMVCEIDITLYCVCVDGEGWILSLVCTVYCIDESHNRARPSPRLLTSDNGYWSFKKESCKSWKINREYMVKLQLWFGYEC